MPRVCSFRELVYTIDRNMRETECIYIYILNDNDWTKVKRWIILALPIGKSLSVRSLIWDPGNFEGCEAVTFVFLDLTNNHPVMSSVYMLYIAHIRDNVWVSSDCRCSRINMNILFLLPIASNPTSNHPWMYIFVHIGCFTIPSCPFSSTSSPPVNMVNQ